MKNIIKTAMLAAIILVFGIQSSNASVTKPEPSSLKQILVKNIKYPNSILEDRRGFAVMEFTVNADGTINLSAINASTPELLNYTICEIAKISIRKPAAFLGKTHYYRIDFVYVSN